MDEHLTISTPEQVAFQYEMAGIGSRFVASLLDHLILITTLVLINCAFYGIVLGSVIRGGNDSLIFILLAIMTLVSFVLFWGYFVLFETIWNGQTPGKRS
ncbi:MAG: RDD family protein, partial [Chloroflexia bacterium]